MFKKLVWFVSFICFTILTSNILHAAQPSAEVLKIAEAYAQHFCGGRIDAGVPYYGPGKGDIVWGFTIYKNNNEFPTKNEIQSMVAVAREKRLNAEVDLAFYRQDKDKQGIKEAQRRIAEAYAEMRNEKNFAAVYVADFQNGYKILAKVLHHGLPLHYTAYLDAKQRALNYLKQSSVDFERYIYLSPTFIHGGFKGTDSTAYVNLNREFK